MKKSILTLVFVFSAQFLIAQSNEIPEPANFKLYPTENMYNFLKLDTRDGTIQLVQWSLEGDTRFEYPLNLIPLVAESERRANRFALYATQNSWTFILLDQKSGSTWQVQWSTNAGDRLVVPINYMSN